MSAEANFVRCRLDSIAQIGGGLALGRQIPERASIELPYLRVANVQEGRIDTSDIKTVRILPEEVERYSVKEGDLLLTEGGDFDKLGRGAVWDGRIPVCLHQNHVFRVRVDREAVLPEYLSLYMASSRGRRYFLNVAKQTTNLATISSTQLKVMPVEIPDMETQHRIVDVMDSAADLERTVESEVAKLATLRGVLVESLAGHPMISMRDILIDGPRNGVYKPAESYGDTGTPIVRISSFDGGPSDLTSGLLRVGVTDSEVDHYGLDIGDVLINRVNAPALVGKATVVARIDEPTIFESNIMRCRVDVARVDPLILQEWLSSSVVRAYFASRTKPAVSQASINREDVLSCPIPDIRREDGVEFLGRLRTVDCAIYATRARIVKLLSLKRGLAADLLSGKLPVNMERLAVA